MPLFSAFNLFGKKTTPQLEHFSHWYSHALGRNMWFDVYLPPKYQHKGGFTYPLLLLNDGQDLPRMDFVQILADLYQKRAIPHLIAVGIHAGPERIREYGVTRQADYKGRGDKAGAHKAFVINELMPFLSEKYALSGHPSETVIAGFSLGGLSALDIAFSEPGIFGGAGVFSGALWWRSEDVNPAHPDAGRIMHDIIHTHPSPRPNDQLFWLMAGGKDEAEDRNNNGIIDAIDDTIDCIKALRTRGYRDQQLRYLELPEGTHDPHTWGKAMPDFLDWMFNGTGGGME